MQFKTRVKTIILTATMLLGVAFGTSAENKAHHQAHSRLQAKNVTPMERQATQSMIEKEVAKREQGLSKESERMIDDLLKEAKSHLGKPYRHGAKGPSAFDCSGFTSYVYKQFGYNITPASRGQQHEGVAVKKEDIRKGDILCFTSPRSGKAVGHVGIVYSVDPETGAVKFIHAGQKGIAIVDFAGSYERRFVCARRIITE